MGSGFGVLGFEIWGNPSTLSLWGSGFEVRGHEFQFKVEGSILRDTGLKLRTTVNAEGFGFVQFSI